jgi:hypothetical protein
LTAVIAFAGDHGPIVENISMAVAKDGDGLRAGVQRLRHCRVRAGGAGSEESAGVVQLGWTPRVFSRRGGLDGGLRNQSKEFAGITSLSRLSFRTVRSPTSIANWRWDMTSMFVYSRDECQLRLGIFEMSTRRRQARSHFSLLSRAIRVPNPDKDAPPSILDFLTCKSIAALTLPASSSKIALAPLNNHAAPEPPKR